MKTLQTMELEAEYMNNIQCCIRIKRLVLFFLFLILHIYFALDLCAWCLCMTNTPKPLMHLEETEFKKVIMLRVVKGKIH